MNKELDFLIRPGKEEDIPEIVALVKRLAEYEKLSHKVTATEKLFHSFGFGPETYFRTLLVENLSEDRPEFIGFALYFFTFSTFEGRPTLYLEDLFVLPEYRGKGIGKRLLVELADIARQKNCGRMEWAVLNWNTPAIEFYKRLGAMPMDEWTVYRLEGKQIEELAESE